MIVKNLLFQRKFSDCNGFWGGILGGQEIRFFEKIGFLLTIWIGQNFVKLPIFKPSPKSVTIRINLLNLDSKINYL